MNTPSPKFFCPDCGASFEVDSPYCGRCGADMHHASGLRRAAKELHDAEADEPGPRDRTVRATNNIRSPKGAGPDGRVTSDLRTPSRGLDLKSTEDLRAVRDGPAPNYAPLDTRPSGKDSWLGRVVDSRYRVVEVIGRGGMGVVYKVEHQRMSKIAAMKVLHREFASDTEVIGRFRREAEAVSRLTHPNTVQVFDFGTAYGSLYLIMEYVRGTELRRLVKRDGPIPFLRAAPLFGQIGAALAEAHATGIVHRDLKPENVLVTRTHRGRDFVKVLDFGLAKLGEREELTTETDRNLIVGTPYYMSPEQIRGDEVDPRSDIYSMGALMYKVLTGEYVFTSKTPVGVLTKHLTNDVTPASERAPDIDIPPAVDDIILRALEKEPEDRFQSIEALLEALESAFAEACANAPSGTMRSVSGLDSMSGSVSVERMVQPESRDDPIDYGINSSIRLQRADLEVFERSIRRRRKLGAALVPVVLMGVAAAVVYLFVLRGDRTFTRERESNNKLDQATLIADGTKVTGYLGRRIDKATPDRDYYRIKRAAAATGDEAVWVEVTGLPNIDVELTLVDGAGRVLDVVNEGGVGHGEAIRGLRVRGTFAVMVTETKPPGPRLPTENVSDAYTLTAELRPIAGAAAEPNDSAADCVALAPDQAVTGYLDRRKDVDMFQFGDTTGSFELMIDGAAEVPLSWRIGKRAWSTQRRATINVKRGDIIELKRTDESAPHGQALPGAANAYTLSLRKR